VELAATLGTATSGSLIVAAIASVFTIGYVANLLGEDEDWLHELSIDMFPEDGRLWIYGVGEDGVTAFTEDGIENLRPSSTSEPAAARRHRSNPPNSPAPAVLTAWKLLTRQDDLRERHQIVRLWHRSRVTVRRPSFRAFPNWPLGACAADCTGFGQDRLQPIRRRERKGRSIARRRCRACMVKKSISA
jgi:hypothetical protein